MMLQFIDKKIKVYFYIILFLLFSTLFNLNISNNFEEKFKIIDIQKNIDEIEVIEINKLKNTNIFSIDKKILINLTEDYPILKSFEVKKIYPNILKVHFEKAKPIAKINSDENYIYLGDNGKIFKSSKVYDSIPEIQGKVNLEYLNKLIRAIHYSPFDKNEIKIIKIYPSMRFDIIFNNNKNIKFPSNLDPLFMKYAFYFYKNMNINENIIDLRLENKVIVKNE